MNMRGQHNVGLFLPGKLTSSGTESMVSRLDDVIRCACPGRNIDPRSSMIAWWRLLCKFVSGMVGGCTITINSER